ncbi:hypothetical protein HPB50_000895 [Hyalomma asiaticum]|uniref:Uncharacterized protein n=1 Tax=Hyalomma asiaticum TaxID=266040 RepID=A0ACB7SB47_HYAAI|nr:hypothetical protein HPB50_000895 [Hyalomma asiaticum]
MPPMEERHLDAGAQVERGYNVNENSTHSFNWSSLPHRDEPGRVECRVIESDHGRVGVGTPEVWLYGSARACAGCGCTGSRRTSAAATVVAECRLVRSHDTGHADTDNLMRRRRRGSTNAEKERTKATIPPGPASNNSREDEPSVSSTGIH